MLKAISYNDCLQHFNSPFKYEPMRNGDKVKWVYLKDNPLGLDGLGALQVTMTQRISEILLQPI